MTRMQLAEDSIQDSLPEPGRYRHFKGDEYKVVSVARHSETEDWLVVYYQVDEPERLWVRPAPMFLDTVNLHGCVRRRFELTEPAPEAFEPRFRHLLSAFRFWDRAGAGEKRRRSDSGLPHEPHAT